MPHSNEMDIHGTLQTFTRSQPSGKMTYTAAIHAIVATGRGVVSVLESETVIALLEVA